MKKSRFTEEPIAYAQRHHEDRRALKVLRAHGQIRPQATHQPARLRSDECEVSDLIDSRRFHRLYSVVLLGALRTDLRVVSKSNLPGRPAHLTGMLYCGVTGESSTLMAIRTPERNTPWTSPDAVSMLFWIMA